LGQATRRARFWGDQQRQMRSFPSPELIPGTHRNDQPWDTALGRDGVGVRRPRAGHTRSNTIRRARPDLGRHEQFNLGERFPQISTFVFGVILVRREEECVGSSGFDF
jgi:hypothetical protein